MNNTLNQTDTEKIYKHIKLVNFTAYFLIGWSFFLIFMMPIVANQFNLEISLFNIMLGIAELLTIVVLSVGVIEKRYVLLWPILIILIIDSIGVSLIFGISGPLAILFRVTAIALVIVSLRSTTLLKNPSNFNNKRRSSYSSNPNSEKQYHNYEYNENIKNKSSSDFEFISDYYLYVLNLETDSNYEEIKRSYKSLIKLNHPDKYEHLGEEFRNLAEAKTKILNEAMDYFKNKYNIN